MIKKEVREVKIELPIAQVCDICLKEYPAREDNSHVYEWQEFTHLNFITGFNSVFGDESEVRVDICQYCLYSFIKDGARIVLR